jgi:DNA gyrase subunit B
VTDYIRSIRARQTPSEGYEALKRLPDDREIILKLKTESIDFVESVRMRPGMYIGSTEKRGLHYLIEDFVNVWVDHTIAGFCDYIEIVLNVDGSCSITSNSPTIPVMEYDQSTLSSLELLMTRPYELGHPYQIAPQVCSNSYWSFPVINALSEWAWVEITTKEGEIFRQDYVRGVAQGLVRKVEGNSARNEGNLFCFKPDLEIFDTTIFDWDTLAKAFNTVTNLTRGLTIKLIDRRDETPLEKVFRSEEGILFYLKEMNKDQRVLHQPIFAEGRLQNILLEVAIQYNESLTNSLYCFINHTLADVGGTPVIGFRDTLTRTLNLYARKAGLLKPGEATLSGENLHQGLTAVINIKLQRPNWWGPMKNKGITNPEARTAVSKIFGKALKGWLEEHTTEASAIIEKAKKAKAGS